MKFKVFAAFVAPSIFMMLIFIAFPLISVIKQSFYVTQTFYETVEVESCTPALFGAKQCTTETKTQPLRNADGSPVTRTEYVGLQPDDAGNRSIRRASASAMLTMMGNVVLLIPLLKRTWRDHRDTMTFWSRRFCWTRRTSPWFRPSQICSTARRLPPIRSSQSPQRFQSRPHFSCW